MSVEAPLSLMDYVYAFDNTTTNTSVDPFLSFLPHLELDNEEISGRFMRQLSSCAASFGQEWLCEELGSP